MAGVQRGQREEASMAQAGQHPSADNLHANLHLRLVARLVGPGRDDGRAVVAGQIGIGAVDQGLVEAGPSDAGAEIVADRLTRSPAEEGRASQDALSFARPSMLCAPH